MNRHERRRALSIVRAERTREAKGWSPLAAIPGATLLPSAPRELVAAYRSNVYSVQVYEPVDSPVGVVTPACVRRHDAKPVRDWYDMQRIKNDVFGEDRVAVEVYPATADLTDDANLYWLWVLPEGTAWRLRL